MLLLILFRIMPEIYSSFVEKLFSRLSIFWLDCAKELSFFAELWL
jgi:hypothetical protein